MVVKTLLMRLTRWANRLYPSENTALIVLAIISGLTTGLGIWLFRLAIDVAHLVFSQILGQGVLGALGPASLIITLGLAGLIVGWLMERFVGPEKLHGVAGIMEAVALVGGRLRYSRMPFKAVASAISLGAGASVGPEDPSVQIGANLGSMFGQRLGQSEERTRLLVASGAASAVAAAFHAPIAGVFFALEVILGEFTTAAFGVVVLAAVISSVTMQVLEPLLPLREPSLSLLNYTLGSLAEIPLYALLGLVLAPAAALFTRTMFWQHDLWHRLGHGLSRPLRTALAGVVVGAVGIFLPDILGPGREAMNRMLASPEEFTLGLLLILGFAKIFMTAFSIGAGFVGGIFAPSLFVGLTLGGAFGRLMQQLQVNWISDPQAFAIVGMAAMMAGVVHAPITAIMIVFELTNDYRLIIPIMLAAVVCIGIAQRFVPLGIYKLGLARHNIHLKPGRDIDVMQGITVGEAMTQPAPTIHERAALVTLRDTLRAADFRSLCVIGDHGRLTGIVSLSDLQAAYERQQDGDVLTVGDICTRTPVVAHPDDVLWTAIRKLSAHDIGRLPVVDQRTGDLLGMLSRSAIMRAYNVAIARKLHDQHQAERIRLSNLTGAHVIELHVEAHAPADGAYIRDLPWPGESVAASILRRGKLLIPHGSTQLQAGDVVTLVVAPEAEPELRALFQAQNGAS